MENLQDRDSLCKHYLTSREKLYQWLRNHNLESRGQYNWAPDQNSQIQIPQGE